MAFFDLVQRPVVVVGCYGDVAAVDDRGPAVEWVSLQWDIVASVKVQSAGSLTDSRGPETGSWAVGGSGVEWSTYRLSIDGLMGDLGCILPIKAMSYFTSSLAKHGKYGRRPKVEIPEKTESACLMRISLLFDSCSMAEAMEYRT